MSVNSTVELMTLWASSSPSLVAFCFSHVIIAVLLLGGRGCAPGVNGHADEYVTEGSEAETPDATAAQVQGSKRNGGGHDDAAIVAVTVVGDRGCAPEAHCCAEECSMEADEIDEFAVRIQTRQDEESSARDDVSIAADASSSEEKCGHEEEEEDELMRRAEEFIQRMNRVWRTESVRVG